MDREETRGEESASDELCLFDAIAAVQDEASDDREVVAVLRDLLDPPRKRLRAARLATLALGAWLLSQSPARADDVEEPATPVPMEEPAPQPPPSDSSSEAPTHLGFILLPTRSIYEPLLADPQWARFAVEYQSYHDVEGLRNVADVAFGGMLPVFQGDLLGEGRWELGVQAGVFSIFDLDGDSFDLINTDFWAGVPFSVRWGWFSAILRVYHQSSHLGDEFLLRTGVDRVNLSYEAVDLIPSFDLWTWGRVYLGGGYLFNRNPDDLERKYVLGGVELESPVAFRGWLRPIGAFDVHRREEQDWRSDYSARLGVQFENAVFKNRRLLLLAEYYKGRSPNGQFFDTRIEYWGAGLHFFF